MGEYKVVWSSSSAPSRGDVKATMLIDPEVGLTVISEDGLYLTCCSGPLSPLTKGYNPTQMKSLNKHYPKIVRYAYKAAASGVFNVDDMERFVFGDVQSRDGSSNPNASKCAFNV